MGKFMIKFRWIAGIISFTLLVFGAVTNAKELTLWGVSYHLGGSYPEAPRGLDSKGVVVINPGLGFIFDSREFLHQDGFSAIFQLGYFQDCDKRDFFYSGPGLRYRQLLIGNFSLGGSTTLAVANGEQWATGKRGWLLIPFPLLEGTFHFEAYTIGFFSGYSPKNISASATSGGGLIFSGMNLGF